MCSIYVEENAMEHYPSLPGIKAIYQQENEKIEQICTVTPNRPWKP